MSINHWSLAFEEDEECGLIYLECIYCMNPDPFLPMSVNNATFVAVTVIVPIVE